MLQHREILAKIAIEKSDDALKSSCDNLDINLNTALNRAYYAVFYIVSALAYIDEFVTKSHHKLMGQFNKKYIYENKIFDNSLTKIYKELIRDREKSDYDFTTKLTREIVLKDIQNARTFIEAVKPYVLDKLRETKND